MPPINHLNPPPNPFWDFVADMQDHPFFAAYAPHVPRQADGAEPTTAAAEPSHDAEKQQQPSVEDPPEIDPATLRQENEQNQEAGEARCSGRRRCGSSGEGDQRREWHGRRCARGGRRGFGGPWVPPPFGPFGGAPFWARGPHHPPPPPPPGFGPGPHGRGGHPHRGGPPHHHGPHHGPSHDPHHDPYHHGRGRRGPSPPPAGGPGEFDLGQFLNNLGSRIGVDLTGAAEGLGLDRFLPSNASPEVDFEPKVDIFDRAHDFIVHLSLPGAKKSDVGVEWDGEHSLLRVAGVVYRPEVDEAMLAQLAVDGRKRETGVFEKSIRLGTRRDPAVIDVAGIKAKMIDGVLIVTVPKSEKQHQKRDVPIAKSQTPSPVRDSEKTLFDADKEMVNAEPDHEIQLVDRAAQKQSEASKGKQAEYDAERNRRESSATVEADEKTEHLPQYKAVEQHEIDDWEQFDSEEEGEFIKINVD